MTQGTIYKGNMAHCKRSMAQCHAPFKPGENATLGI